MTETARYPDREPSGSPAPRTAVNPEPSRFRPGTIERDFAGTFVTGALRLVCSGITSVALARMLGPAARGEFTILLVWTSVIGSVALMGNNEALCYYVSARPEQTFSLFRAAVRLTARTILPAIPIAMLVTFLMLRSASASARALALLLPLVYLPANFYLALTQSLLQGSRRFFTINWLLLTGDIVYCFLAVAAWILARGSQRPLCLAVAAYLATALVTAACSFCVLRSLQREPDYTQTASDPTDKADLARYGRSVAAGNWVTMLGTRFDELFASQFLSVRLLGLYSVAKTITVGVNAVPLALSTVLLPRVVAAQNPRSRSALLRKAFLMAVGLSILVLVPSLVALPYLLPLAFGRQFAEAVPVAAVLLTSAVLAALSEVAITALKGMRLLRRVFVCRATVLAVQSLALVLLTPSRGLLGTACAVLIGTAVGLCMTLWFVGTTRMDTAPTPTQPNPERTAVSA